jgi:hypothetical protein
LKEYENYTDINIFRVWKIGRQKEGIGEREREEERAKRAERIAWD